MILDVPLDRLRTRRSVKWQAHPADVLPLWVAEMDVDLAPPIHEVLTEMVAGSDTGYAFPEGFAESYAGFAGRRWGLTVDPARTYVLQDVMRGVLEVLQVLTDPGDAVVITPPVYQPFSSVIEHAGRRVAEAPLVVDAAGRWGFDLEALDAAFAAGAPVLLLCSPHNPVGRAWTHGELTAVADIADRHGARVIVDEIHAPLVHTPRSFVPFASIDVAAAQDSISLVSASKAWNLAGLKAAIAVASSERGWQTLAALGPEVGYGTGILGVAAGRVAFDEGEAWLDQLLGELDQRRRLLRTLLAATLPGIGYVAPEATFLAWLDCRALGLDDPYGTFLERGRVALEPGTKFGPGGDGFVRLNLAASEAVLTEAVERMAAALQA